ncbi:MAG TPA: dihydrodipicolinate reductase C-terminal domain-containing protein [Vicinamibacterales bacterium]|nr:dihydrodipicolinate reductase C-terminal domain-containing protein [Vicinamibacterales bacterium]
MSLILIGHGRMGRLVEQYAVAHGFTVAGIVTEETGPGLLESRELKGVEAVIDFSVGTAVKANLERIAARGWNTVIGTTGWQADEDECRALVERAGIGVIASANFSMGMNVFRRIAEDAAKRFAAMPEVGAWIHETHHIRKKDAPSGTALMLQKAMEGAGYARKIDMSSTRAGFVPGTHEIGFDAATETVTLTHTVRDRAVFAHGALEAARWITGRRGWHTMDDLINDW